MNIRYTTLLALGTSALAISLHAPHNAWAQQGAPSGAAETMPQTPPPAGDGSAPVSETVDKAAQAEEEMRKFAESSTTLVGKDVYGSDGEEIGAVEDVVLDADNEIEAILVEVGGILGLGAKTISIPLAELKPDGQRIMTPDYTASQAEAIPEYVEG